MLLILKKQIYVIFSAFIRTKVVCGLGLPVALRIRSRSIKSLESPFGKECRLFTCISEF